MARRRQLTIRDRAIRASDRVFDVLGMRPSGLVVFFFSALLLFEVIGFSEGTLRADAVAMAGRVDHPAHVASFVTAVFVKPGDRVVVGTPLAELSPYFVQRRLERIDAELEQLINESKLAQARLIVEEERWIKPTMRMRPNRPSLKAPTEAFYAKQIETLTVQRKALIEELESLVVASRFPGVVAEVAWLGASIAEGASVASIMPEHANEIVAYIPPMTDPHVIAANSSAYIVGAETPECRSPGLVRRQGATVVEAPAQLTRYFRPVYGTPVHISMPEHCWLSNGQVLAIDFEADGTS